MTEEDQAAIERFDIAIACLRAGGSVTEACAAAGMREAKTRLDAEDALLLFQDIRRGIKKSMKK